MKENKILDFPINHFKLSHMAETEQEIWENGGKNINSFLTLDLNFFEQDLNVAAELKGEQTRILYTLATEANP